MLRQAMISLLGRFNARLGLRADSNLLVMAAAVGTVTAAAAVGFHELINLVRDTLYLRTGQELLYGRGIALLILFPALGGAVVGILTHYIFRAREGHGIVDVIESVVRGSKYQSPVSALEKILTAGVTIGSGGSAGAEGPIVQIGAGIATGIGRIFRV